MGWGDKNCNVSNKQTIGFNALLQYKSVLSEYTSMHLLISADLIMQKTTADKGSDKLDV